MARKGRTESVMVSQRVVAALDKHCQRGDVITLGGVRYKVDQLRKMFQAHVDAWQAAQDARIRYLHATREALALETKGAKIIPALRSYVVLAFGGRSEAAAAFGFTVKKRRSVPVQVSVEAVKKRAATRKARSTMGKKQKAKIKGTVPT